MNEAHVVPVRAQDQLVVIQRQMPRGGHLGIQIRLLEQLEPLQTAINPFRPPVMLAELVVVAAHGGKADGRSQHHVKQIRRRGGFPDGALIDPRAQQTNLGAGQRLAFALRRHLEVRHQAGDVVDQRAPGTVAHHNINAIFPAFERPGAVIEPKSILGPFRAVTAQTRGLKHRFDVPRKVDLDRRRGRQLGFRNLRRQASRRQSREQAQRNPSAEVVAPPFQ